MPPSKQSSLPKPSSDLLQYIGDGHGSIETRTSTPQSYLRFHSASHAGWVQGLVIMLVSMGNRESRPVSKRYSSVQVH